MNMTNAAGTISAVITILLGIMTNVLQCSTDAAGEAVCKASFLSPQMAGIAMAGFAVLTLALKIFRPGGMLRSLFGSTAVVVPEGSPASGSGTVTPEQVKLP